MASKVDFSEFDKYYKNFSKLNLEFNAFLLNFLVEQAERTIAKTKKRTPVDTGALRNAWQIGEITGSGNTLKVQILNDMEYATSIEYGRVRSVTNQTGWVDGYFMLTISLDEIREQMPSRFNKQFKAFCKDLGI